MEEPLSPNYSALWLRVWQEPSALEQTGWLVQVFTFADGQSRYFDSPERLFEFLRSWLPQTNSPLS